MGQVTNPLSVKTRVQGPKSSSALLHPLEREKVFLEVHIQNMTQDTMCFDRMEFECAEGWRALDANRLLGPSLEDGTQALQPLFSGSMALMQPQAVRQYIYILFPTSVPTFPVTHPPGAVIPLGRLDISWHSKFGEPGRLLTSVSLSIPAIACARLHGCSRTSSYAYRCSRAEFPAHSSRFHRYHRSPLVLSRPTSNAHHRGPFLAHPDPVLPSSQYPDPARLPWAR